MLLALLVMAITWGVAAWLTLDFGQGRQTAPRLVGPLHPAPPVTITLPVRSVFAPYD